MNKILINTNGKVLVSLDGKLYKSPFEQTSSNNTTTEVSKRLLCVNNKILTIDGKLLSSEKYFNVQDIYLGPYEIIPEVVDKTLPTKDKILPRNIKVTAIPYTTTSNNSGGSTITIGEAPTDINGETILLSL